MRVDIIGVEKITPSKLIEFRGERWGERLSTPYKYHNLMDKLRQDVHDGKIKRIQNENQERQ